MNNNDVISILNDLIETCRDGQESFRTAAKNIHRSDFRRLFSVFSQQRAQFVSELQAEADGLGGEISKRRRRRAAPSDLDESETDGRAQ